MSDSKRPEPSLIEMMAEVVHGTKAHECEPTMVPCPRCKDVHHCQICHGLGMVTPSTAANYELKEAHQSENTSTVSDLDSEDLDESDRPEKP